MWKKEMIKNAQVETPNPDKYIYMIEMKNGIRIDMAFETIKAAERWLSYLKLMHGIEDKDYMIVGIPVFDEEYIRGIK